MVRTRRFFNRLRTIPVKVFRPAVAIQHRYHTYPFLYPTLCFNDHCITIVGKLGKHLMAHCHTDWVHGHFLERFWSVLLIAIPFTDSFKTSLQTMIGSFTLTFHTYLRRGVIQNTGNLLNVKGAWNFEILANANGTVKTNGTWQIRYLGKRSSSRFLASYWKIEYIVWREFKLTVYKPRINKPDESKSYFDR